MANKLTGDLKRQAEQAKRDLDVNENVAIGKIQKIPG